MTLRERLQFEASYFRSKGNVVTAVMWASTAAALRLGVDHWWSDLNYTLWLFYTGFSLFVLAIIILMVAWFQALLIQAARGTAKITAKLDPGSISRIKQFRVISLIVSIINVCLLYAQGYTILGALLLFTLLMFLICQPIFRKQLRELTMLKLRGVVDG